MKQCRYLFGSGMLRGVEGRQKEAREEGEGGGGGGGDAADDEVAGREKRIRKVKAFCQHGRLLAAAADEGQREGVDGDGEGGPFGDPCVAYATVAIAIWRTADFVLLKLEPEGHEGGQRHATLAICCPRISAITLR